GPAGGGRPAPPPAPVEPVRRPVDPAAPVELSALHRLRLYPAGTGPAGLPPAGIRPAGIRIRELQPAWLRPARQSDARLWRLSARGVRTIGIRPAVRLSEHGLRPVRLWPARLRG